MSDIIVSCSNIRKTYSKKEVLKDINFTIKRGEISGLVGLNGAGKTTLIRILTGIINPTSGSFSLFDQGSDKDLHKQLSKVSTMIEHPAIYKDMSALDNLKIACLLKDVKDPIGSGYIKDRLSFVGLETLYSDNKKVKNFSLGMKQRLGIAMATIGDPELMILDEPTNGLDPEGIQEIRSLLVKINKERGTTIVVSSHILSELSKFATSYLFLVNGVIKKQIDEKSLENSVGKILMIKTDRDEILLNALKEKGFNSYKQGDLLYIKDYQDTSSLLNFIYSNGVNLSYIKEHNSSLEDYFLSLVEDKKL